MKKSDEYHRAWGGNNETGKVISSEIIQRVKPHIVNLNNGRLSSDGIVTTNELDLSYIFDVRLKDEIEKSQMFGKPCRIVIYAHGGLVSESSGIKVAAKHVDWWLRNGIYPIYFTWETGLIGALSTILRECSSELGLSGRRDLWDHTTDPLIELAGRALGTAKIWSAMKRSAERGVQPGGGALEVASRLSALAAEYPGSLELHAIGHSAGANFHAEFLRALAAESNIEIKTLHLLAPAINIAVFKKNLLPLIAENRIALLRIFSMNERLEREDTCGVIYRKSLLYFVASACEERRGEPILGLEESVRGDRELIQLFGLDGAQPKKRAKCEIVLSSTSAKEGLRASQAETHGGFDDDPSTMNAVMRSVLEKDDGENLDQSFPNEQLQNDGRSIAEETLIDWPDALGFIRRRTLEVAEKKTIITQQASDILSTPKMKNSIKRALCVGIDGYKTKPLRYCVADAKKWDEELSSLGFDVLKLHDDEASRDRILDELAAMVKRSSPGDVLVFQYAGHGVLSPYADLDPATADDNAIVPIDGETGQLIFDYEMRHLFGNLPEMVNLTCFMDCCHSETNTRQYHVSAAGANAWLASGRDNLSSTKASQETYIGGRFIDPTSAMRDAFERRSAKRALERKVSGSSVSRSQSENLSAEAMENVSFAACQDRQVAYELDGSGRYTNHAISILKNNFGSGITNRQFHEMVKNEFIQSGFTLQIPALDCKSSYLDRVFLKSMVG
ncbi:caspase family protein [Rhizobium sp. GN54]|uniref:caspase family protein n=1 Tax=Rhizobium sp. GN54 TaxID=2898150 RepID=UPI001E55BF1B|nr:caspase family protein [Rhizobium sp. GN54]MCD2185202.1 caspase family protein [Rhizobium sp. GN54]